VILGKVEVVMIGAGDEEMRELVIGAIVDEEMRELVIGVVVDEEMKELVIGAVVDEEEAEQLAIVARSKEFSLECFDTIKYFKKTRNMVE
jgi:nitrogen regulatory protein PII-like uncharacterized protein